jgi:hypothetical protein
LSIECKGSYSRHHTSQRLLHACSLLRIRVRQWVRKNIIWTIDDLSSVVIVPNDRKEYIYESFPLKDNKYHQNTVSKDHHLKNTMIYLMKQQHISIFLPTCYHLLERERSERHLYYVPVLLSSTESRESLEYSTTTLELERGLKWKSGELVVQEGRGMSLSRESLHRSKPRNTATST